MANETNRDHFLTGLSEAVCEFLDTQMFDESPFAIFGKKRVNLGSESIGKSALSLVLYQVHTEAKPTETPLLEEVVEEKDATYVRRINGPWLYSATFALVGPAVGSAEGMKYMGQFHALLFDHPYLPSTYLEKHNVGFLQRVALRPCPLPDVLGAMSAKFSFATGTTVSVEKRVLRRDLRAALHNNPTKERESTCPTYPSE